MVLDPSFPQSNDEFPVSWQNAQISLKTRQGDVFDPLIHENLSGCDHTKLKR
jgi:hypothetical protein